MKKFLFPLFSFLLVFSILFTSIGSVNAAIGDDPVVTPVSGDSEFSTEVVPVPVLPGTTLLASQMIVPVGFPLGEAQFEGNGIRLKGFDSGKATVCFSISSVAIKQGWSGKVGVWNGSKWVLLPTVFNTPEETIAGTACAPISGNGTYVYIRYVVDSTLVPTGCVYDTSEWSLNTDSYYDDEYFYVNLENLPNGTPATLTFISADPSSDYSGFTGTDSASVGNFLPGDADFYGSPFYTEGNVLVTLRVDAAGCSKIMEILVDANIIVD
jgi:hypothetical protein